MGGMSRLLISRTGPPLEVVELQSYECPAPGPGEVVVRMAAAAVNPADLNFIEGSYGKKAELPCVPGMEGAGFVEKRGPGVAESHAELTEGALVMPLSGPGNWASRRVVPAEELLVLPAGMAVEQAALLRVNPATAWGLLHAAGSAPAAGSWVVQNAGSSAAGHCVIQVAKSLGLKTLSFVRREESRAACLRLGGDLVFVDDAAGAGAAKEALRAAGATAPLLALNAVGGDSSLRLLDLLGPDGTHVTYGAMARQPLKVPNGMLIFKCLVLRGFWLTRQQAALSREELAVLYSNLAGLAVKGGLTQEIAAAYPISEYREALAHAPRNARNGKVILTF
ncbi:MAG: Alcohol dehydrogenase zinc-binding domain protein [Verrucomicrobiales bacterium]|nr:Alcohol dehydrogenase zinc-binding domain protein [Verrucomicrobiales bacterium]